MGVYTSSGSSEHTSMCDEKSSYMHMHTAWHATCNMPMCTSSGSSERSSMCDEKSGSPCASLGRREAAR